MCKHYYIDDLLLDNRRTSSERPNGYTQSHGCGFPYLVAVIRSRAQLWSLATFI